MKKKIRVYAFIDSQNLNLAIRDQGWKLDFERFLHYLKVKFQVKKAFLFIGYIVGNEKLYKSLKIFGFTLVFKPTLLTSKKQVKGNVDAELVLHSMIEYKNYDQAIIISGDGDFYCLIKYLVEKKKLKKLIIPNKLKYSRLLKEFNDKSFYLNDLKEKLRFEDKKRGH